MSAYIVDRQHIQYLVEMARKSDRHRGAFVWGDDPHQTLCRTNTQNADMAGQMLWDENFRSVCDRYPDDEYDNLPGDNQHVYGRHDRLPLYVSFDPPQVLKACDCYSYQSCEHPGWDTSEAKRFIMALLSYTSCRVTGYDEAEWGAPKCCYLARAKAGGAA